MRVLERKFLIGAGIFFSLLLLGACEKSNEIVNESQSSVSKEVDYLAKQLGYSTSKFKETADYIFLDNDIMFTKEGFWRAYRNESSELRVHRKSKFYPKSFVVYINCRPSLPQVWKDAVKTAVANWNKMPSSSKGKLTFSILNKDYYVSSAINVELSNIDLFTPKKESNNWGIVFGSCDFPNANGVAGKLLISDRIGKTNSDPILNKAYNFTAGQRVYLIAHELGHGIGIAHTDTKEGLFNLFKSSSCNTTDPNSIFLPGIGTSQREWGNYTFTPCDKDAYIKLCEDIIIN